MIKKSLENKLIYTIGHSNRPIEKFINILLQNKINMVVDVRSIPGSNKNPQYNKENLNESLKKQKIKYIHIQKLGGLRNKSKAITFNNNYYWNNKSFRNYADYALLSVDFEIGFEELLKLIENNCCAIMCAEVLWWKCHRRIITDYLLASKIKVFHIFEEKNIKKAFITEEAHIIESKKIFYPKTL